MYVLIHSKNLDASLEAEHGYLLFLYPPNSVDGYMLYNLTSNQSLRYPPYHLRVKFWNYVRSHDSKKEIDPTNYA